MALQATVMVTKMIGLEFSRYLQSSANNFESKVSRLKLWDFSPNRIVQKNKQNRQTNKNTRAYYVGI